MVTAIPGPAGEVTAGGIRSAIDSRIEFVEQEFGETPAKRLHAAYFAIYRHSSEIMHGSFFGAAYFLGFLDRRPTDHTDESIFEHIALAGNALLFAPIVGVVVDMPLHGFFAMLNLYYVNVYKKDAAPDTSKFVGRWFYMQPLTPPGKWWGGLYLMPEFQPIYDFETDDSSFWVGLEFGKMVAPGKIAYIKPGWGINNSEPTDRGDTFEVGFRWFF